MLLELQQLLRQTDGVRLVVSSSAIFDRHFDTHTYNVSQRILNVARRVKKRRPGGDDDDGVRISDGD